MMVLRVESLILTVRGAKVLLDSDLAKIYGVSTARLNEQVRRNIDRFPGDFAFQLTREEFKNLISQIATSSSGHGGRRKLPHVFTEHGAIMAANVLRSKQAVQMSVFVVRAFVRLRAIAAAHQELAAKLKELEQKVGEHDNDIQAIIKALRHLMQPPEKPKRQIGFRVEEPKVLYKPRKR
jgi:hypothetical protein